ncbi:MAG: carbonic anhydrase [Armatimonadetes bacterium]|nr:carbonic anhydrase [Armatimonadota bacterium]
MMQRERDQVKTLALVLVVGLAALFVAVSLVKVGSEPDTDVRDGLVRLKQGNARFVADHPQHPGQSASRREHLLEGQHPYAVVVACSDSRVPPELIFDAGLGELFVVRSAGEVLDAASVGSVEYAVEHLHVPTIAVLGHSECGAVKATIESLAKRARPEGYVGSLIDAITPAVVRSRALQGDPLANAVQCNVSNVMAQLAASRPVLFKAIGGANVRLAGGIYDLKSGRVDWME